MIKLLDDPAVLGAPDTLVRRPMPQVNSPQVQGMALPARTFEAVAESSICDIIPNLSSIFQFSTSDQPSNLFIFTPRKQ